MRSARRPSTSGSSSRRRASSSSRPSRSSSAPRRASAARAGAGSSRMRLRSSSVLCRTGAPEPATPSPELPGSPPGGEGRGESSTCGARVLVDELGDRFGVVADDDVLGHDRARGAAVVDREERVVVGLDRAGRGSGPGRAARGCPNPGCRPPRACGSRRSARRRARRPYRRSSLGTETPSVPQAARTSGGSAIAVMTRTGRARGRHHTFRRRWQRPTQPTPTAVGRAPLRGDGAVSDRRHRGHRALADAGPAGLSANAVSSLSLEPPLMLACLDRGSRTLRAVEEAGRFGVNVLGADQAAARAPASHQGPGGREVGRGRLDASATASRCSTARSSGSAASCGTCIAGGDHVIVTGAVLAVEASARATR